MDVSRRNFLTGTAAALVVAPATAAAADAPKRMAGSQLKLSLAAYSFNRLLPRRGTTAKTAQARMTLEDFIIFCAEQQLGATELTGYYFPQEVTTEYLLSLKERTHRLGLTISGTAIGNDFCLPEGADRDRQLAECRDWIDYAAIMGAPVIRIFAGRVPNSDSEEVAMERCVDGINESLKYAATKGVFLALENHGGITATPDQVLKIVDSVDDSPWFGVNFDSGNFDSDDPYRDLERIAPFAVNAQIKVAVSVNGQKQPANLKRTIEILKAANYRGFVALEYEENDPHAEIPKYLAELRELI